MGNDAGPEPVFSSEASKVGGLAHGLLNTGWCGNVDRNTAELVVNLVLGHGDLIDAELSRDAACPAQQGGGARFLYVDDLVAHDRGRVEHAPLDVDAGMKCSGVVLARKLCWDLCAMQSEVYFVHSGGTAVQKHAGPLMGPYHLMVAPVIDHHNGDV